MRNTLLAALAFCAIAAAQTWIPLPAGSPAGSSVATMVIKPMSLFSTRKVIGGGRTVGLWSVGVCNDTLQRIVVPRLRLMAAVPDVVDLPNDLAEDVVGRQTAASPASFLGANGDRIMNLVSSGLMIGGVASGTGNATYAGLGLAGLSFVFQSISKTAPTAQPYFSQLLPAAVPLDPGACSQYYVFASLMKGASPRVVRLGQ